MERDFYDFSNWTFCSLFLLQDTFEPSCQTVSKHKLTRALKKLLHLLTLALRTNQLEVKTDVKTLRPVASLKEPRDLFALPKERENDCAQQLPRWPNECQVSQVIVK